MNKEEERKHVKIQFTLEEYEILEKIKRHYNLRSDTETIRLAIGEAYKVLKYREENREKSFPNP